MIFLKTQNFLNAPKLNVLWAWPERITQVMYLHDLYLKAFSSFLDNILGLSRFIFFLNTFLGISEIYPPLDGYHALIKLYLCTADQFFYRPIISISCFFPPKFYGFIVFFFRLFFLKRKNLLVPVYLNSLAQGQLSCWTVWMIVICMCTFSLKFLCILQ